MHPAAPGLQALHPVTLGCPEGWAPVHLLTLGQVVPLSPSAFLEDEAMVNSFAERLYNPCWQAQAGCWVCARASREEARLYFVLEVNSAFHFAL